MGIRANAIAPGAIMTPLFKKVVADSPDPHQSLAQFAVLHAPERPDDASFVSGQVLAVDGGATARCFRFAPDATMVLDYRPMPGTSSRGYCKRQRAPNDGSETCRRKRFAPAYRDRRRSTRIVSPTPVTHLAIVLPARSVLARAQQWHGFAPNGARG